MYNLKFSPNKFQIQLLPKQWQLKNHRKIMEDKQEANQKNRKELQG